MSRRIHNLLGLLAALLVSLLALSGVGLSVFPALDRLGAIGTPASTMSVADLAARVASHYPEVEQIRRTPSGRIIAFYFEEEMPRAVIIDPANGQGAADYAPSPVERWTRNLHRSLFLGDAGRIVAGAGALAMAVLLLTGLQLTARRMGGWRQMLRPARGPRAQRVHVGLGRPAAGGLLLSAFTGVYMALATFEILPEGPAEALAFPEAVSGGPPMAVGRLSALQAIDVGELRELTFPYPGDPTDAFAIETASGAGYVDQATGQMLAWQGHGTAQRVYETIYMLHTGQGIWWLGLTLGLAALVVPVMSVTGVLIWWARRRARPRIRGNAPASLADIVILVGSEGGSTWGFAGTVHAALTANGHKVHTAPMDDIGRAFPRARQMLILAATYGAGAAPASAGRFMDRLEAIDRVPGFPVAVLGFGDRQYSNFCGFAQAVATALAQKGWASLMPLATIHRQNTQEFARWGAALSEMLGEELILALLPERPRTHELTLLTRADYGEAVQAPTSILRFAMPRSGPAARLMGRAFPRFTAGDLLGVMPPGSDVPRYYSLAAGWRDGMLEICVRKHPGGLCSCFLHGLRPGDTIEAFVKRNPEFRPSRGSAPVILIGAGTGIGPLAGFARANHRHRPMHLYFGGRHPDSDYLYEREIKGWLADGRLARVTTAFSRITTRAYVQDRIRHDAEALRALIAKDAQIMVCGGHGMAAGVMTALEEVLMPLGVTPAALKAEGRYAEDVY
jgi:sulfite reductase (NADPH) flavoprotein alpha-component